jgi:hypothetical protein
LSVEQPFAATPAEQWARSESAGVEDSSAPAGDDEAAAGGPDELAAGAPDELGADAPVEERVRRHVAALDGIADLPLSEHAQRYDEVHAELQAALTEIDGESG